MPLSIIPGMDFAAWRNVRGSFAIDALIALALLMLVVLGLTALVILLGGSSDPSAAMAANAETGMLILPP
jgi:hypothetical protein